MPSLDYKNRGVAKTFMVLSIVLSSVLGNGRSLNSERKKVVDYFFNAEYSVANDVKSMAKQAENLSTVANKYSKIDSNMVSDVKGTAKDLKNSDNANEMYKLSVELEEQMNDLYNELLSQNDITDNDLRLAKDAYTDYNSYKNTAKNSDYNDKAEAYNDLLDTFPSSVFKNIHRVGEVGLYK